MADIQGKFYNAVRPRTGTSPSLPPTLDGDPQDPVNPPGTNPNHPALTLGTNQNGLTLDVTNQILQLGLSSSSTTGALSSTDWSTFNGKIGGTGTINYVSKFTASGIIGNSSIQENNGFVAFGASPLTNANLRLSQPATAAITGYSIAVLNPIQSDVTSSFRSFQSSPTTQATSFTLNELYHYIVSQGVFGAGSTVSNQFGVYISSNMIGATNNYAFRSDINSGTGRWNLYMLGTANNYLAGNLWIGTSSGTNTLDVNGTARIRSISNATGNFLTTSATGVIQQRTAAQVLTDIGAQGTLVSGTNIKTINGSSILGSGDLVVGADSVLYTSQSRTASEKLIARTNIGSTSSTPQIIATSGAINDLVITSNHLVFTGALAVLSGIVAGLDGEEITLLNASGTNLEILSESVLSSANNRFSAGVIVPSLSILRIKYRTTSNRWFLENVGINDSRYVRKDVADTKTGNLTLTNGAIINGFIDVNGSAAAAPGVALNRFRNAAAGSGITQFFGTNGGASRQHFAFYGSGDVEYISFGNGWVSSNTPTAYFRNPILCNGIQMVDGSNIGINTTTGTKIGTSTSQKIALWNATPIVQPTTAVSAATFVANTSGIANDTATFDGYTIGQVVKALRNMGALA